jgi:predicted RNA-binding protein with PIN domain
VVAAATGRSPGRVLVVDGANVVGSRPDGWWKDRAGAARRLHERLLVADLSYDVVVLVVEGAAKGGVRAGRDGDVRTVHARRSGDDEVVAQAEAAAEAGGVVTVVTADRMLQARATAVGASSLSPSWLLDQL